jgi:hypothetical protein
MGSALRCAGIRQVAPEIVGVQSCILSEPSLVDVRGEIEHEYIYLGIAYPTSGHY